MSDQLPLTVASCSVRLQYPCVRKRSESLPGLMPRRPGGNALLEKQSGRLDPPLAGVAEPLLLFAMFDHGPPRPEQGAFGTGLPLFAVEVEVDRAPDRQLVQMLFFVL